VPELKLAAFNCEWMASLFGAQWKDWDGKIPASFPGKNLRSGIKLAPIADVPGPCKRIAGVIREVDPDIIGIEEGPPLNAQMELFVEKYTGDKHATYQSNERWQSVFALVRRPLASRVTAPPEDDALRMLRSNFYYYLRVKFKKEDRKKHRFDRVPLALSLKTSSDRVECWRYSSSIRSPSSRSSRPRSSGTIETKRLSLRPWTLDRSSLQRPDCCEDTSTPGWPIAAARLESCS